MKNTTKPDELRHHEPQPLLRRHDVLHAEGTRHEDHAHEGQAHEHLVAHHLAHGADAAQQGVLVVRCPARPARRCTRRTRTWPGRRAARCRSRRPGSPGAMGMTAKEARVVIMMIAGAMTKTALSANGRYPVLLREYLQHVGHDLQNSRRGRPGWGRSAPGRRPGAGARTRSMPAANSRAPSMTPRMTMIAIPTALISRLP